MLVLSRKCGQIVSIGGTVKVTVLRINGNRVRLGIEAPENVRIVRSELGELPLDQGSERESGTLDGIRIELP